MGDQFSDILASWLPGSTAQNAITTEKPQWRASGAAHTLR